MDSPGSVAQIISYHLRDVCRRRRPGDRHECRHAFAGSSSQNNGFHHNETIILDAREQHHKPSPMECSYLHNETHGSGIIEWFANIKHFILHNGLHNEWYERRPRPMS